eukprot:g51101.t1
MEQYLNDAPRAKEWFPEYLHGVHTLSKAEVADDISSIHSKAQSGLSGESRSQRLKRKAAVGNKAGPTAGAAGQAGAAAAGQQQAQIDARSTGREPQSKRSRLAAKVDKEYKLKMHMKATHTQLRQDLEALRNEVQQYRDAIAEARRSTQAAIREKEILDERYLQLSELTERERRAAEESRRKYRQELVAIGERLRDDIIQSQELAEEKERLLHKEKELEQVQRDIKSLEDSIQLAMQHRDSISASSAAAPASLFFITASSSISSHTASKPAQLDAAISQGKPTAPGLADKSTAGKTDASKASEVGQGMQRRGEDRLGKVEDGKQEQGTQGGSDEVAARGGLSLEQFRTLRHNYEVAQTCIVKLNEREEELEELKGELKEKTQALQELQTLLTQAHTQLAEVQGKVRQAEKQAEKEKEKLVPLNKQIEELKRREGERKVALELWAEKEQVFAEALAVADERADAAEDSLKEVINELNILRVAIAAWRLPTSSCWSVTRKTSQTRSLCQRS